MSCVMALLPNQETCEKLCRFFFATVFPLIPIFHTKGFAEDFRSFWDGINPDDLHNSEPSMFMRRKPAFLSLLSAVLFAALSATSPARLEQMFEHPAELNVGDAYFITMVSTTLTGFPRRPSVYSLAAYIIAQSQFVREEEFSDAPDFIGTSFRVALGMGLHRQLPESSFGAAELETRRRLWWYILHLDVMSSASSGLSPLFINQKMANTEAISQYDPPDNVGGDRQEVDIRYLVASHRYAITKEMREILVLHFEDSFETLEAVEESADRLRRIATRISPAVETLLTVLKNTDSAASTVPETRGTMHPDIGQTWTLQPNPNDKDIVNFSAWSAMLLHLMVHKAYCVLYHPLFRDPAMVAHDNVGTNAVKHAQAFIQLFIRVCNDPISEPYHWMYPGTYQPLQAVSLLLADLLQHPHSDDATLSRGLIDAIFELYQVDEGIVSEHHPPKRQLSPSGREAWTMLVRTRQRTLQQVGMDHHVLFPSSIVTSNRCICGEKISVDGHDHRGGTYQHRPTIGADPGGQVSVDGDELASQVQGEMDEGDALRTPGEMLYDHGDFDWHAWDNALGPSVGLMP
ncbi:hypothetical protein A1O7_06643 [Cladophialophora yegresii CBS 114405]|uniref:Xylanolytic transcriptional activator regulatory domain-containing protein n=1 Tax=Cladophialophora yegresii CBS 114405 TaxID=1182544 RepID=W9W3U8_9EURO|nr:uncharacterized protein A1O7_06643 [Cladophialophora yegresii CBS 114405]EXJ59211.1 hypothetical protein A1O7_06643 [Cladophialophora yegresii CBS 114405]